MVLRDIVGSLRQQGIRKLLIFNGHGGNIFKGMIRDLMLQYPDMLIGVSEWFAFVPRNEFFDEAEDDHAGEQETSTMLYYFPDLVRMELAGDGSSKPFAIEGLNKKVGWVPRDWSKTTQDTGVGFPKKASAEKGKKYMEAVIPKLVQLVVDLVKKEVY
jgi:creatinine amidohydrolase